MVVKFLGAAGQVTGSCFLLTASSGEQIIIDCGMFQGEKNVELLNYQYPKVDTQNLIGVLLTHAHLDHCGRLPLLVKDGFSKSIWMTPPTRDIAEISLFDTAHINQEENPDNPLFTKDDVVRTTSLFKMVDYNEPLRLGPFMIIYNDAGHIIGSSSIEVSDFSAENKTKIVFSGDLGNSPEDLIKPTETITSSDYVVMETTYGDALHPVEDPDEVITSEINAVAKTGGALLIPSFSIERSQEVIHKIGHLKASGKIPANVYIFFDSPMGEKVTQIFEQYPEYLNQEILGDAKKYNPFRFPGIIYTSDSKQSRAISETSGPKVIIAGSGMMTGGRILNHSSIFLPLSSSRLLFVGYQAEDTLGRKILEGARSVVINGVPTEIKASVTQIQSLSSHADQAKLLKWLIAIKEVKRVFLVHGEDKSRTIFAGLIQHNTQIKMVEIPKINEAYEIN